MPRPTVRAIKTWIKQRNADPVHNMALFTSGSMILIAGLMLIILAERLLVSSVQQELLALLGVGVAIFGGLRAFYGYLSIGLFKLLQYFFSDK